MSKENRNMRDIVKICDYKKCTGCEACVQCCPNKCINMIEDKDGFLYPYIKNRFISFQIFIIMADFNTS